MRADPANSMNSYQGLVTSDFYGIEIANGYVPGSMGVNFFISTDGGASVSPSSYPDTATVNGGGAVVSAGEWHYVAGTYDGTKLQLYIDGQPWGAPNYHSGAISPMLPDSFVSVGSEDGRRICPFCTGNRYFNGQIDEPAIYNRALSASEIQAIYLAGHAGKCAIADTPAQQVLQVAAPSGKDPIQRQRDGSVALSFAGVPGRVYRIQYTDSISNPDWHDLGTRTADSSGVCQFTDRPPTDVPTRYYRAVSP